MVLSQRSSLVAGAVCSDGDRAVSGPSGLAGSNRKRDEPMDRIGLRPFFESGVFAGESKGSSVPGIQHRETVLRDRTKSCVHRRSAILQSFQGIGGVSQVSQVWSKLFADLDLLWGLGDGD